MVKEHVHVECIRHCSAQDFYDILYATDSAAKAYHKQVDKDADAQVESWRGDERTVLFKMPMQLPGMITKMIGTDVIPVREEQRVERGPDGSVTIVSVPHIGVPGGNKFQAVSRICVTDTGRGCKVAARVTCTADGPWGLQGMIEGVMIDQSIASVRQYLDFCVARCNAALAERRLQAGEPDPVPDSPRSDDTTLDQFWDARENFSRTTSTGSGFAEALDAVALVRLLDSLEGRLGQLSADVAAMRSLLQPRAARAGPRPARTPWLALGLGAAAAAGACLVLYRQRCAWGARTETPA